MKVTKNKANSLLIITVGMLGSLGQLHAQYTGIADALPQQIELGGMTKSDGWYNLSSATKTKTVHGQEYTFPGITGYPTFFGSTGAWPSSIESQLNSSVATPAELVKTANGLGGGPFPSGDSMYYGSFGTDPNAYGGSLAVQEANPLTSLQTVTFQVQFGGAWTYDFVDNQTTGLEVGALTTASYFPQLTLTLQDSSTQTLTADWASLMVNAYNGTVEMPSGDEDVFINLYGFQWDLSSYDNIVSFDVEFSGVEHAQLYALQLDQSTQAYTSSVLPVPEPASASAILGVAVIAFVAARRRKRVWAY
ncbi:PEP-CTERM sorting domain-containing protein [Coraliomargarita sp. SDUM461004]|uniref:PEP-CTERM sorting domain-containing protein n=1 Tax=Thalassobacterium sedimentorum TaxID=3041258 RepID=A0ABU1AM29_9BACT|nr:PEP-CTERM sorting domain-containing protein [Coraliomargarita sp. SDUM461004]MDQ8195860.1 PEP-CTERM sorting domain-containing protein [Coraliomargarita sp. SDUM461004]